MRRVLIGVVVTATMVPGTVSAQLGAKLATIGCPKWGYLMTAPDPTWFGLGKPTTCSGSANLMEMDGLQSMVGVDVERHGSWNDALSRSSIRNDELLHVTKITQFSWDTPAINGHRYYCGKVVVRSLKDPHVVFEWECETFVNGYMYKARAFFDPEADVVEDTVVYNDLMKAMKSLIVTGPQVS